jgi:SOS response regulatory protein OraA/RecX
VAVEVDGVPWRTLPAEVVLRSGLAAGVELERPRLRTLRRELRRHHAIATATRALRARPLSAGALDERLRRRGFVPHERTEALGVLQRGGFVDDERFAAARAAFLAERHSGDALIRHDLRSQRIDEDTIERAMSGLEPENVRAVRAAASRKGAVAKARYLARRGFDDDAIEAVVGDAVAEEP